MYEDTQIKFKNGEETSGVIQAWHPVHGWFSIWDGFQERKIRFEDVESAVTPDCIGINYIFDRDELQRAHEEIGSGFKNAPD